MFVIFHVRNSAFQTVMPIVSWLCRHDLGEPGKEDLNVIQAADYLQKNGIERTAIQRKEEVNDIDLDSNGRICLIEYYLLHYKVMFHPMKENL